jgi:hypothetical protein
MVPQPAIWKINMKMIKILSFFTRVLRMTSLLPFVPRPAAAVETAAGFAASCIDDSNRLKQQQYIRIYREIHSKFEPVLGRGCEQWGALPRAHMTQ